MFSHGVIRLRKRSAHAVSRSSRCPPRSLAVIEEPIFPNEPIRLFAQNAVTSVPCLRCGENSGVTKVTLSQTPGGCAALPIPNWSRPGLARARGRIGTRVSAPDGAMECSHGRTPGLPGRNPWCTREPAPRQTGGSRVIVRPCTLTMQSPGGVVWNWNGSSRWPPAGSRPTCC